MKSNFALSLSFEGIRLLHRAAGGWRVVGDVSLDAPDMAGELAVLRRTATALEPSGLRTKVLLPNPQIKFLTIETPDQDHDARVEAARDALDGATPYAVEELSFDVSADGPNTHIAAVAHETLVEAEAFAAEHQFNPICFAAVPGENPYLGEPFFGPTLGAKAMLKDGEDVEPDGIAVVIIGNVEVDDGPVVDVADPAPETDKAPEPQAAAKSDDDSKSAASTAVPPADLPKDAPEVETKTETKVDTPEPVPERAKPVEAASKTKTDNVETEAKKSESAADTVKDDKVPAPEKPAQAAPALSKQPETKAASKTPEPVIPKASEPVVDSKPEAPVPPAFKTATAPEDVKAVKANEPPFAKPVETAPKEHVDLPKTPVADLEDTPAEKLDTPEKVVKADISTPDARTPAPPKPAAFVLPTLGPAKSADTPAKAPPVAPPPASSSGFASRRAVPPAPETSRREPKVGSPGLPRDPAIAASAVAPDDNGPAAPQIAPAGTGRAAAPIAAASAAAAATGRFFSRRRTKAAAALSAPAPAIAGVSTPQPRNEAERMTVFGARSSDIGGKPRFLGLFLTAALLVLLAGVAAWASVFLDDGLNLSRFFGDRTPRVTASVPIEEPAPDTQQEAVVTASLAPTLTEEDTAVLDALRDPVPQTPIELTDQQIQAIYATSGIWAKGPQVPPDPAGLVNIEDLYLTSIDPVSTANDAVALPAAVSFATDVTLGKQAIPAAAGIRFAFDARGFVVPTPQGAPSPDGFTVFLGRPPVEPPAILARFQAAPQDEGIIDSPLAGFRPKLRPGGLSESNERAQLDGLTRSELSGFRPKLRPKSLQEEAAATAAAQTAIAAVDPEDTDEAVEAALAKPAQDTAFQNATRLAIKASARPDTRPRNFQRIVRRAQRTPAPQEETRVASTRQIAPRVVTPKIPSKTSVARQATVKNAINLRKVNLIGVYGKPSSRRALVRLSNGRYKKVVVGDRIDGGRVSAIGNSELRYTKGGRNVVLKMPRG